MADAKRNFTTKTVTEKKTVAEVTLTLSREEAELLKLVTGSVSGAPEFIGRKHSSAVYYALSRAGVGTNSDFTRRMSGSLRFTG